MSSTLYTALAIAICAVCTILTRVFPFVLLGGKLGESKFVRYLGQTLPPAVMSVLVIYCLRGINFTSVQHFAPQLISVALVVLLHLWKRNNLLSIGVGTVCYMLLVQQVF